MSMKRLTILLSLLAALFAVLPASAQQLLHRGKRTMVRGGMMQQADSLRVKADSLALEAFLVQADSIFRAEYEADSLEVMALRTDDRSTLDSVAMAEFLIEEGLMRRDTTRRELFKKGWFMSDSMGISKVCWGAALLPGYGQIYNKQYWKLPILYTTLGASIGLYIHENKTYKPLRKQYDAITNQSMERTPELDALQTKMIRSNTKRQLFLAAAVASYVYFIGDAAINYATNDVSSVKKATTLACICPGAGQIYNKSYWKVPFVVGGFATLAYCIDWNNRGFQRFKKAYNIVGDYEKHPEKYPDGPTDEFRGRYSGTFLKNLRNNYRRNRDLCIILTGGMYLLQIIDAHVDAHLKDYDISDDLSININPMMDYTYQPSVGDHRPVVGLNMSINF